MHTKNLLLLAAPLLALAAPAEHLVARNDVSQAQSPDALVGLLGQLLGSVIGILQGLGVNGNLPIPSNLPLPSGSGGLPLPTGGLPLPTGTGGLPLPSITPLPIGVPGTPLRKRLDTINAAPLDKRAALLDSLLGGLLGGGGGSLPILGSILNGVGPADLPSSVTDILPLDSTNTDLLNRISQVVSLPLTIVYGVLAEFLVNSPSKTLDKSLINDLAEKIQVVPTTVEYIIQALLSNGVSLPLR